MRSQRVGTSQNGGRYSFVMLLIFLPWRGRDGDGALLIPGGMPSNGTGWRAMIGPSLSWALGRVLCGRRMLWHSADVAAQ